MQAQKQLTDPYSGEQFYQKRPNQIYANRSNQIRMGNHRAREIRLIKKPIDLKMSKNRVVLKNILGNTSETIKTTDFLLGAGLDFGIYSHCKVKNKVDNIIEYYVYEYGIVKSGDNKYKIFKNE